MRYFLYNALWRAAAPVLRRRLSRESATLPLLERFQPELPPLGDAPVWVHACSVGEVNTALPFLKAAQEHFGAARVLLTTSTATGRERAHQAAGVPSAYFPFDHPRSVRTFLDAVRPRALVLVETELWPNVLRECARRDIPVAVINGRISEKHFKRYQRLRGLTRGMFRSLGTVGAQSQEHADRFIALGADAAWVRVTGNLKFDAAPLDVPQMQRSRIRASCGIPEQAPLLVFGSTRPGDEALASACWATLREEVPGLHMVIAPRHVERRDEVLAHFGEPVLLRSLAREGHPLSGERVVLVDTMGELTQFYAAATLAVVGGSFYPGVEGHNPLEPAALGAAPVFGPYMKNFAEAARMLLEADAAVQVPCAEDLYGVLSAQLRDTAALRQRGTRARRVVLDNQGAARRNLEIVKELLGE
jgi:3-deoxy-D-manno-octulosonic-acid transferase